MTATTPERSETESPVRGVDPGINKCLRCGLTYSPAKSTSALRLTYCSFLCELGHLGFSISGLEHMERVKRPAEESETPE